MHAFKVMLMAGIVIALASWASWMVQPKAQLSQTGMGQVAGGSNLVACGAAQFDFSDACNIVYFTGVMTP